jgi:hypothetical protein
MWLLDKIDAIRDSIPDTEPFQRDCWDAVRMLYVRESPRFLESLALMARHDKRAFELEQEYRSPHLVHTLGLDLPDGEIIDEEAASQRLVQKYQVALEGWMWSNDRMTRVCPGTLPNGDVVWFWYG